LNRSQSRHFPLALVLSLLLLAFGLPGRAQEVLGTNAFCQQFGRDCAKASPDLRQSRAHWLVGVDCSGSMLGKLDPLKAMLQVWLKLVVVAGDRLTILPFDNKVLAPTTFDVKADDYAALAGKVNPLLAVHSGKGTALDEARGALAKEAVADQQKDPTWDYVTIILSDRDDRDQGAPARISAASTGDFEDEQQYLYVVTADGQKKVSLRSLIRVLKPKGQAGSIEATRKVPLTEPRDETTPGSDPDANLRHTLGLVHWIPAGLALLMLGWLFGPDSPGLFLRNPGGRSTSVPWWIGKPRLLPVHASRNRSDFCLEPVRSDMGDRLVLKAMLANPWALGQWRVRLTASEGMVFGNEEQELEWPRGQHQLVIKDKNGVLVDRPLVVDVKTGTLMLWRAVLGLIALSLALWVLVPMFPTRPATPGQTTTVSEEAL
jgi:hypothetical protein